MDKLDDLEQGGITFNEKITAGIVILVLLIAGIIGYILSNKSETVFVDCRGLMPLDYEDQLLFEKQCDLPETKDNHSDEIIISYPNELKPSISSSDTEYLCLDKCYQLGVDKLPDIVYPENIVEKYGQYLPKNRQVVKYGSSSMMNEIDKQYPIPGHESDSKTDGKKYENCWMENREVGDDQYERIAFGGGYLVSFWGYVNNNGEPEILELSQDGTELGDAIRQIDKENWSWPENKTLRWDSNEFQDVITFSTKTKGLQPKESSEPKLIDFSKIPFELNTTYDVVMFSEPEPDAYVQKPGVMTLVKNANDKNPITFIRLVNEQAIKSWCN